MGFRFFIKLREKFGVQVFAAFTMLVFVISISFMILLGRFQYTTMLSDLENKARLMAEMLAHQSRIGLYSNNKRMLENPIDATFNNKTVIEATLYDQKAQAITARRINGWGETAPGRQIPIPFQRR